MFAPTEWPEVLTRRSIAFFGIPSAFIRASVLVLITAGVFAVDWRAGVIGFITGVSGWGCVPILLRRRPPFLFLLHDESFTFGASVIFGLDHVRGNFDFPTLFFQLLPARGFQYLIFSKFFLLA